MTTILISVYFAIAILWFSATLEGIKQYQQELRPTQRGIQITLWQCIAVLMRSMYWPVCLYKILDEILEEIV